MNIKLDVNSLKQILYERYKEIIVILIYIVIFGCAISGVKSLAEKKDSLEYDESLAKRQYDVLRASNLSEDALEIELKQLTQEVTDIKERLPQDLKKQDINDILTDIIENTGGLFNLGNIETSELRTKEDYIGFEVLIKALYATDYQFKNMLNYINDYVVESQVTELDVTRTNSRVQGRVKIEFYGQKGEV